MTSRSRTRRPSLRARADLLRLFGHEREHTLEARRFWAEQVGTMEAMMTVHEMEGYDEVSRRFLELMSPEDVVRAIGPEQLLPAMPVEVLRALSDEFVAALPEPARSAIRKRLGR